MEWSIIYFMGFRRKVLEFFYFLNMDLMIANSIDIYPWMPYKYTENLVKRPLSKRPKNVFQDQLLHK